MRIEADQIVIRRPGGGNENGGGDDESTTTPTDRLTLTKQLKDAGSEACAST